MALHVMPYVIKAISSEGVEGLGVAGYVRFQGWEPRGLEVGSARPLRSHGATTWGILLGMVTVCD